MTPSNLWQSQANIKFSELQYSLRWVVYVSIDHFLTETLCLKMQAFWFLSRIRRYLYEVTKQTTFLSVNNVHCNFPKNFARFHLYFQTKKNSIVEGLVPRFKNWCVQSHLRALELKHGPALSKALNWIKTCVICLHGVVYWPRGAWFDSFKFFCSFFLANGDMHSNCLLMEGWEVCEVLFNLKIRSADK